MKPARQSFCNCLNLGLKNTYQQRDGYRRCGTYIMENYIARISSSVTCAIVPLSLCSLPQLPACRKLWDSLKNHNSVLFPFGEIQCKTNVFLIQHIFHVLCSFMATLLGFSGGSDSKESAYNVGELGSILGLGRSLRRGHGNPLQYSCLENPHEQRCLVGYSPQGHKESDMTE